MASPTWYFDDVKRRIYEVPPGASYVVDGGGYRIYDGGPSSFAVLTTDVKKDLWSRWVDWHALHDWAALAFSVSGGGARPTGEKSSADFTLLTASNWRIVLADYPHETIMYGNLFAEGTDSLFDFARMSVNGIVPRLQGSANMLTYSYSTGGNVYTLEQIKEAVWANTIRTLTGGIPTALDNAVAVWTHLVEYGYTAEELIRLMAAINLGNATGLEGGSINFKSLDGLTDRVQGTYAGGTRTISALDGA